MTNAKRLFGIGIPLLIIGVVAIIAAVLVGTILPNTIEKRIKDSLIIEESESKEESYQHWISNNYDGAAPLYKSFTFFNLTNANDVVLNGSTPRYETVGPYHYRTYKTKNNVTFSSDGKEVGFMETAEYVFDDQISGKGLNPLTDQITTINPSYIGVLKRVGSEASLSKTMIGPVFGNIMNNIMGTVYTGVFVESLVPSYLGNMQNQLINQIKTVNNTDQTQAEAIFYDIWTNATTDPSQYTNWNDTMRISVNGNSSGISLIIAKRLFDANETYSMLNTTSYNVWYLATNQNNANAQALLMTTFNLNLNQFSLISQWRLRLKAFLLPQIAQSKGLLPDELGLAQWGNGTITPGVSAQKFLPFLNLPAMPEFAFFPNSVNYTGGFSVNLLKALLITGQNNLTSPTNNIQFLTLVQGQNWTMVYDMWGLNPLQATALAQYFIAIVENVYVQQTLSNVFMQGGGLIRTQSVNGWLWNSQDPLLNILNPGDSHSNFFTNQSTSSAPSHLYTGKGDINQIKQYIVWDGQTQINVWREPETVGGTDATQFRPSLAKSSKLTVWTPDLLRQVELEFQESVTLHKIHIYRYEIVQDQLKPNDKYYQQIEGFANMTNAYNNVPVFLCKPNMLGVPDEWVKKVIGMNPNKDQDDTFIDVDPLTGSTFRAHKRLQLNLYIDSSYKFVFNKWNPNATVDLFYPVLAIDENSELTEKQANDYRKLVLKPLETTLIVLGVGLGLGAVITIVGVCLVGCGIKHKRSLSYEQIS